MKEARGSRGAWPGRGRERSGACGAQVHTGCSRARGVRRASRGGPRVGPGASARAGRGRGRKPPALLRAGSFWLVLREELPGDPRGLKPPLGSSGPARRLRGERGRTDAFRPDPSPLPRTRWVAFLFKSDGFRGNLREASRWILWVAPELSDSRFAASGLCARVNSSNWHVPAVQSAVRVLTLIQVELTPQTPRRRAQLGAAPAALRDLHLPGLRNSLCPSGAGPWAAALRALPAPQPPLRGPARADPRSVQPCVLWLLCSGVFRLESRLQGSSAAERGSGPRCFSGGNNIPWTGPARCFCLPLLMYGGLCLLFAFCVQ